MMCCDIVVAHHRGLVPRGSGPLAMATTSLSPSDDRLRVRSVRCRTPTPLTKGRVFTARHTSLCFGSRLAPSQWLKKRQKHRVIDALAIADSASAVELLVALPDHKLGHCLPGPGDPPDQNPPWQWPEGPRALPRGLSRRMCPGYRLGQPGASPPGLPWFHSGDRLGCLALASPQGLLLQQILPGTIGYRWM
jgi:hypothetical protein